MLFEWLLCLFGSSLFRASFRIDVSCLQAIFMRSPKDLPKTSQSATKWQVQLDPQFSSGQALLARSLQNKVLILTAGFQKQATWSKKCQKVSKELQKPSIPPSQGCHLWPAGGKSQLMRIHILRNTLVNILISMQSESRSLKTDNCKRQRMTSSSAQPSHAE